MTLVSTATPASGASDGQGETECASSIPDDDEAEADDAGINQDDQQNGPHGDQTLDQCDVRNRAGHHVADAEFGEKLSALFLKFVEERLPQIKGNFEGHPAHAESREADHTVAYDDRSDDP